VKRSGSTYLPCLHRDRSARFPTPDQTNALGYPGDRQAGPSQNDRAVTGGSGIGSRASGSRYAETGRFLAEAVVAAAVASACGSTANRRSTALQGHEGWQRRAHPAGSTAGCPRHCPLARTTRPRAALLEAPKARSAPRNPSPERGLATPVDAPPADRSARVSVPWRMPS